MIVEDKQGSNLPPFVECEKDLKEIYIYALPQQTYIVNRGKLFTHFYVSSSDIEIAPKYNHEIQQKRVLNHTLHVFARLTTSVISNIVN